MKPGIAVIVILFTGAVALGQAKITPDPVLVNVGGTIKISLEGRSTYDRIQWQVLPPSLGNIDASGLFTAGQMPGQGVLRAIVLREGKASVAHALIRVVSPNEERLKVALEPQQTILEPGAAQKYRILVRNLEGREVQPDRIEWKVVPKDLGEIDENGLFIAAGQGRGRIVALARQGRSLGLGQAQIAISPGNITQKLKIDIAPQRLRLEPGQSAELRISVADGRGQPVPAEMEYQLSPPSLGSIDPSGRFTAGDRVAVGTLRIVARYQGAMAQARVLVTVANRIVRYRVQLRPKLHNLEPNQTVEIKPVCLDHQGNQLDPPYWVWKVIPEDLGTITPEGIFTAGPKVKSGKIVASLPPDFGQGSDFASVRIRQDQANIVRVSPAKVKLKPGESVQFTVQVFSPQGMPLDNVHISWKVFPEDLGQITSQGLFTAGSLPKLGAVLAILPSAEGGGRGYAAVAVTNFQVTILGPRPRHVNAGESHQFVAEVRDQSGNTIPGAQFEWSSISASPNFGSIDPATGLFSAGHPLAQQVEGMVYVKAKLEGHLVGGDGVRVVVHRR